MRDLRGEWIELRAPFLVSLLFIASGFAQTRPAEIPDQLENLDFASGRAGGEPAGWLFGPSGTYRAQVAAGAACISGKQCGMLQSIGLGPHERGGMSQTVDATPYRNKVLVFGAAVRVTGAGFVQMFVRVHRQDNSTVFYNDLGDSPIRSAQWNPYQIVFSVDGDARDIEFGIQLYGEGAAWIDQVYMSSPVIEAEKEIRELFRKFNEARDAIDGRSLGDAYSEHGEYISMWGPRVAGRANLEHMWSTVDGKAKRNIQKIDVLTPDLAVVRAIAEFDNPAERPALDETFMLVKESGGWKVRVHQAMRQ
jgi:uncharacterized protein (TIGR02246 family)